MFDYAAEDEDSAALPWASAITPAPAGDRKAPMRQGRATADCAERHTGHRRLTDSYHGTIIVADDTGPRTQARAAWHRIVERCRPSAWADSKTRSVRTFRRAVAQATRSSRAEIS